MNWRVHHCTDLLQKFVQIKLLLCYIKYAVTRYCPGVRKQQKTPKVTFRQ